jgi:NAD(P)-dependent dehydrogenase (short-subunit alcohol dehydrogenase family)
MKFFGRPIPKETDREDKNPFWRLDGKVALVTGATGWLGRPIVQGLLDAGAFVFVTSNSIEKLSNLTDELGNQAHATNAIRCNIFEHSELEVLIQSVTQMKNRLDILVNNAIGTTAQSELLDAHSRAKINLAPNLESLWNLTTLATPLLKKSATESGDASVINVASMYGKISPDPKIYESTGADPNPVFYGATKAAVIQMTKWFACNLGESAIRVNSISPGAFPRRETQINNPDFIEALTKRIPLGRIGRPEEISGVVTFLASQASSYITGSDISVDGGWTSR